MPKFQKACTTAIWCDHIAIPRRPSNQRIVVESHERGERGSQRDGGVSDLFKTANLLAFLYLHDPYI